MRKSSTLKSQDILILGCLITSKERPSQKLLSEKLFLSQAEISFGLERLKRSGLLDERKEKVNRLAAMEFFEHALKFIFPLDIGALDRGFPIGPSSEFFSRRVKTNEDMIYIWPHSEGTSKGIAVIPFYETAPQTIKNDPLLAHFFSVVEILRGLGSVRHVKEAKIELERIVMKK